MTPISTSQAQAEIEQKKLEEQEKARREGAEKLAKSLILPPSALIEHCADANHLARRSVIFWTAFAWFVAWTLYLLLSSVVYATWGISPGNPVIVVGLGGLLLGNLLLWLLVGKGDLNWRAHVFYSVTCGLWIGIVGGISLPFTNPAESYFIGLILIGLTLVAALPLPLWKIKLELGQVYIDERQTPFVLYTRPQPHIEAGLRQQLIDAGLPVDLLNKFLDFGGPPFMHEALRQQLQGAHVELLNTLFDQVKAPANQPMDTLWVSALDPVWLCWNTTRSINVSIRGHMVITDSGSHVMLDIDFKAAFDPTLITNPEFRLSLPHQKTIGQREELLRSLLAEAARKHARLFFVTRPLQAALTRGSVDDFRQQLPDRLAAFKPALGLTIKPDSVQCAPQVSSEVRDAENEMIASRARAQAGTARLQALLDQVILSGVPPRLLAGLLLADKADSPVQTHTRDFDMLDLPETTEDQQWRFYWRKYGYSPQALPEAIPPVTPTQVPNLPPVQSTSQPPQPSTRPEAKPSGNRHTIDIRQKRDEMIARPGKDGVYRVDDEDEG